MDAKLKATRSAHKGAVTRLLSKFDGLKSTTNVRELKALDDAVTQKQKLLLELNEKILDQTPEEEMEQEVTDTDEYMYNLDCKVREVRELIDSLELSVTNTSHDKVNTLPITMNPNATSFTPDMRQDNMNTCANESMIDQYTRMSRPAPQMPTRPSETNFYHRPSASRSSTYNHNHKLPKLDLPYFNGDVLKWQTFWDNFETSIHLNDTLTPIQKFSYLNAQLQGSAAETIEGFQLTNGNYETAVNLLQKRYGQTSKLIHAYMKALMNLETPSNNLHSLRKYGDKLESYVRGLESLGQTQDMYGSLLVPVILDKLPFDIRKSVIREHGRDNLSLENLRNAITREIEIIETGNEYETGQNYATRSTPTCTFLAGTKTHRRNGTTGIVKHEQHNMNTKPCVFCQEIHAPANCTRVTDLKDRIQIVRRNNLCFNCLGPHHVNECKSRNTCRQCNKKHHSSICNGYQSNGGTRSNKDTARQTYNTEKTDSNETRHQTSQPASALSVNFMNDTITPDETDTAILHSSTRPHTNVLLKTAIAPVWSDCMGMDANILFDEGAQRSFVTEELARKLKLRIDDTEVVQLSSFGETNNNVRHLGKATLMIEIENRRRIPIEVLVVPTIAVPLQNHIRHLDRSSSYLRGLHLAHLITDDDTFEIAVLIGADYYWQFIEDHTVRGDGPVAVKSKLGYLLSGPLMKTTTKESTTVSGVLNLLISHKTEERDIESFWRLESIGIDSTEVDEERDDYMKQY